LPIVATDDEIRRSFIGKQGFYAYPHNFDSIIKALKKAASSPRLSYAKELKPYHLETVITKLEGELNALIS